MESLQQLHDRNTTHNTRRATDTFSTDTALLVGQMMAELKSVGQQLVETTTAINSQNETISKQTELIHDTQIEMSRYYAGLERANDDIQNIRDSQRTILNRLDIAVSKEQFEELEAHVRTLNGTDSKFKTLGIDINDPKAVEEWRDAFIGVRSSRRTRNKVGLRVLQALGVALALAVCAAAWNGGVKGLLSEETRQEQER
jgi:BMFP domain-containing protein YqiC